MATKKTTRTLAQLQSQIAELQAKADALRKREVAEVVSQAKLAIAHYGLTAADLGFTGPAVKGKAGLKSAANVFKKPRGNAANKKGASRPARYRDDAGNTWVGMGKRPAWFKAALAAGKRPEDLLVKS